MEKIFAKSIVIALLLALLLPVTPIILAQPSEADVIWIEPYPGGISLNTGTVSIDYEFSIVLWAKSSKNCGAWSFRLAYNKFQLAYINCSYTGPGAAKSMFFKDISTVPVAPVHASLDGTRNRIDFGESWAGVGPMRAPGSDSLAIIFFRVIAVPDKGETLESMFTISEFDPVHSASPKTYLIDEASAKYGVGKDVPYTFVWSPPPAPYLISAPTRFYDRYTNWVGTTFVETVTLHVDAAWYLTNASFTMNFNKTFLEITTVAIGPEWEESSYTIDNTNGRLNVFVKTTDNEAGDVLVATVTFNITAQGTYPTIYTSTLTFANVVFWDHTLSITPGTHQTATITVEGYLAVHMPHLEVVPNEQVHGPDYAIGEEIQVNIDIKRLHFAWKLVGMEFRLGYEADVLEVVNVEEGPYLGEYALLEPGSMGTWFCSYIEPDYWGPHILVGTLILPNATGDWNPPFPGAELGHSGENGTIATITFKIKQQLAWPQNITTQLHLFKIKMIDSNGGTVPFEDPVDGTVVIRGFAGVGRMIDVYGGASNAGYGPFPAPWPAPYGGQGPNKPMDLVIPQSEVVLYADVTYNYWPVQQKDVNFEVEGPYEHVNGQYIKKQSWFILLKETARTDADGVAIITFAMPWPCINPESLLGVYIVTATVNIRDIIVTDTLYFYYDYLVHMWKVTTDKYYYQHCEDVVITVDYGSHAMQTYSGIFVAVIKDELNVPFIDIVEVPNGIGGATFCTYANNTVEFHIHVEKWMFAGHADLYINCYDKDPTDGGFAWCPQYYEDDAIYILPI